MGYKYVKLAMIRAPSHPGQYGHRLYDCQRAIEPPAMVMLTGSRAPFFDFMSLLHAILPAATAVGWREDEVPSALETIVTDLRPPGR
jgi:hypothetical protein